MSDHAKVLEAVIEALGTTARSPIELARIVDYDGDDVDLEELLLDDERFAWSSDGYYFMPALSDQVSMVLTVDRNPAEGDGVLLPDILSSLSRWLLLERLSAFTGGTKGLELVYRQVDGVDRGVVIGLPDWVPANAERWVVATRTDGVLNLTALDECPDPTDAQVATLQAGFERAAVTVPTEMSGQDDVAEIRVSYAGAPVDEALAADRDAFLAGPVPPLDVLYEAAGLEVVEDTVAKVGTDWDQFLAWKVRSEIAQTHQLGFDEAEQLMVLVGASQLVAAGDPDALGIDDEERGNAALLLAGILGVGTIARAFWWELDERGEMENVAPFVAELSAHLEQTRSVGVSWLRARLADRAGNSVAAYEELVADVDANCGHEPAFLDLAGYETDRGDLTRAHDLLRLGGAFDDTDLLNEHEQALRAEVEAYRGLKSSKPLGRNDPCPCGSGKKYKACHLKSGFVDFENRAGWLHDKIIRYAIQHGDTEYEQLLAALSERDIFDEQLNWAHGPIGLDLVAWEAGLAERFGAARGELLPPDEAALLAPWSAAERGVFEIRKVAEGSVDLHDVATDRVVVIENVLDQTVREGVFVLARPVPVGAGYRSFTPMIPMDESLTADGGDAVATKDFTTMVALYETLFDRLAAGQ